MKKIIIIATALLMTVSVFAQDGKSIYNKYSDMRDVSSVYISPAMFRLMGRLPDIEVSDGASFNLGAFVHSLTGMYIINSENKDINSSLKSEAERMISKGRYEMLMEVKDSGETVRMYTSGNDKIIDSFVFLVKEVNECTFICFDGKMDRAEVEKAVATTMKNR